MTYIAVALVAAAVGAFLDRWWSNYMDDSDDPSLRRDLHSIAKRQRARQAVSYRRWE